MNYQNRRNGQPWALQQVQIQPGIPPSIGPMPVDENPSQVRFCDEPAYPPTFYSDSGDA